MIQFRFTVVFRVVNTVVNDPELVDLRVNVNTSYYTNALDDAMRIAAVLPSYQFHVARKVLVYHSVIENQKSILRWTYIFLHVFPNQPGPNFVTGQVSVRHITAEFLSVLGIVCQCIINLAHQQVLAIV